MKGKLVKKKSLVATTSSFKIINQLETEKLGNEQNRTIYIRNHYNLNATRHVLKFLCIYVFSKSDLCMACDKVPSRE